MLMVVQTQMCCASSGDEVIDIDFKDYKFSVKDLPEFTSFQIKVVFNGTNSAYPLEIKRF